jgi:predicted transposase YdaD
VTYVTHAERFGFERGIQEGRQEGRREGELAIVLRLLTRRFDRIPESVRSQIEALSLTQLESLSDALLDFTSLADLHTWLNSHA